MNRERRKQIAAAREKIEVIGNDIQAVIEALQEIRDDEEGARDNLPPSLQDGERAQQMQESIDALEEAIGTLESFDANDIGETLERAAA
jgi:flagellar biosynthesis chaperone FliJ